VGTGLPGLDCSLADSGVAVYENVHVGLQRRAEVVEQFPGNTQEAVWEMDVDVVDKDGGIDFRGPFVQGKRGNRFLYLSWGTVDSEGRFEMFRRAKLMLGAIAGEIISAAGDPGSRLVGRLNLTGGDGGPLCAAVRPPFISWSIEPRNPKSPR